jgi:WhiB family transcriptional regulator, redox-sensing transcriptional regulator
MTATRIATAPVLAPSAEPWDWQLSARCRDEDPSIFFHPDGERGHAKRRRQVKARAVCAECPVAAQCLQHALTFQEQFGTWGGLSEDERVKLLHSPPRLNHSHERRRHEPGTGVGTTPWPGHRNMLSINAAHT